MKCLKKMRAACAKNADCRSRATPARMQSSRLPLTENVDGLRHKDISKPEA